MACGQMVGAQTGSHIVIVPLLACGFARRLVTHEDIGWDSNAKEAVTFALLGWLCVNGHTGNIPSCTGARDSAILGKIAPGRNYQTLLSKTGLGSN
jgi:hypothetical protein